MVFQRVFYVLSIEFKTLIKSIKHEKNYILTYFYKYIHKQFYFLVFQRVSYVLCIEVENTNKTLKLEKKLILTYFYIYKLVYNLNFWSFNVFPMY